MQSDHILADGQQVTDTLSDKSINSQADYYWPIMPSQVPKVVFWQPATEST